MTDVREPALIPQPPLPLAGEGETGSLLPLSRLRERGPGGEGRSSGSPGEVVLAARPRSADRRLLALVWARLRSDPVALIAGSLLLLLVVVVIGAPLTAPR